MVTQLQSQPEILYPDSDGRPVADNTKQFRWIVTIKEGLEWLFQNDPDVFVGGDLLWYPVEGENTICAAPDALVAFGRPKGDRGSYQQWKEENVSPQVVFEVLSPGNTLAEMAKKLQFYDRYGVEEYYLYDPEQVDLAGWLRSQERLEVIEPMTEWVSPRLGVRFELSEAGLQLYQPDGERFATYVELAQQRQQERQEKELAQQRAERLAAKLRELNIDPDAP